MSDRTVTTTATASRSAQPTRARVEIAADGTAESASGAQAQATDCAESVRIALTPELVAADRIRCTECTLRDPSDVFGQAEDDEFRARRRLVVDCAPGEVEPVVVAAVDAGATVPAVRFGLADEKRAQLAEEALEAAMERTRVKAERMAAAEGLTVGPLQTATTTDGESGMASIVEDALATGDDEITPSPITVSEHVETTYAIEPDSE